jgi:hypothetical protein
MALCKDKVETKQFGLNDIVVKEISAFNDAGSCHKIANRVAES